MALFTPADMRNNRKWEYWARCWIGDKVKRTGWISGRSITVDKSGNVYVTGFYENRTTTLEYLRYWLTNSEGEMVRYNVIEPTNDVQDACEGRAICLDYTHIKGWQPIICIGGTGDITVADTSTNNGPTEKLPN